MTHDARILDFNHCHLGGRMDHRAALILAASLFCGSAYAGYAQLAPPPGWAPGGGLASGAGGTINIPTAAANGASYSGGTVRTNPALSVGGRAVSVPAANRLAANAGRFAAAAVMAHPVLRTAAAVAAWIGAAGFIYNVATGLWERIDPNSSLSTGLEYSYEVGGTRTAWSLTNADACAAASPLFNVLSKSLGYVSGRTAMESGKCQGYSTDKSGTEIKNGVLTPNTRGGNCPSGWYVTPAGCVQNPPMQTVTEEEFVDGVTKQPMPSGVPLEVPHPLPVDVPEIVPMFIPTGNPVPNPKYDPSAAPSPDNQPWLQPGVKLSPAPMPNAPWQVDLQPVNRPVDSPAPKPDPVQDPVPNPDDKPRDPERDERDLCEKHPDILACQKLDEPEDPGKLKVQEVDFNFQPESGFAGSASCPAPMSFNVHGNVINISWQPFCNSLDMIKPFLLAMAWLSAAFIMLGARKE